MNNMSNMNNQMNNMNNHSTSWSFQNEWLPPWPQDVQQVVSCSEAGGEVFAALHSNGRVTTWSRPGVGYHRGTRYKMP